ncbi:Gfo/Idh/MocA family oxidoreductase [Patescibacteria group bacterium AH-259-L05]|nr:Gfo/Idh/MocA family oxidoreductase [Patescibacteria group bacterium AH-259-L05]
MALKSRQYIAVIGAGYWGKNLVRNFYNLSVLKTICDLNKYALVALKKIFPQMTTTQNLDDIITDPDIKGVVIATPASTHYHLTKKFLHVNKDVFVEKPLAFTLEEAQELVTLAKNKKRILMVGHILHYHPAVVKLKQFAKDGELGNLQYIYSNRLNFGKLRVEENILWSFAPHDISLIINLLSQLPQTVHAHGMSWLNKNVADSTLTYFRFANNVVAHIFVNWLNPFKEQKLTIIGDEKMIVFDDQAEHKLTVYPHKVKWHKGNIPEAQKAKAQSIDVPNGEPLRLECQHFLDCIEKRETPKTDGEESLGVLKVLTACQQSLNTDGTVVKIKY